MILGLIVYMIIGALFIILGLLLWKKQKISLIHDYHHKRVKKADIPAYTRLMGISLMIIGAGCCISAIVMLFLPEYSSIAVILGIIIGMLVMNKAQKKYNGSWF